MHPDPQRFITTYGRFVLCSAVAALMLPFLVAWSSQAPKFLESPTRTLDLTQFALVGGLIAATLILLRKRVQASLIEISGGQAEYLDQLPLTALPVLIVIASALSLHLELAVIRWHGTEFEIFAFYKNVSLLACFIGLGIGYALTQERHIPVPAVIPLLLFKFSIVLFLRHQLTESQRQSLSQMPMQEQLHMGVTVSDGWQSAASAFLFLALIFLITALCFLPIGQMCGRLMNRTPRLQAYGLNLLGSLLGSFVLFIISYFWLSPVIWFSLGVAVLLYFLRFSQCLFYVTTCLGLALAAVLSLPGDILNNRIYTPYQMLECTSGEYGYMMIKAAGHYLQRVQNQAPGFVQGNEKAFRAALYYQIPYQVYGKPGDVVIVGAGMGNDVSAALHRNATHVTAVEIDPAIVALGKAYHPENPLTQPNVTIETNDARNFFRTTDKKFDMVVYGLLDSHTLLSHGSSVRLDSFVYTVQGLREARSRLKSGGILSLSFCVLTPELGRKIYLMLKEAFDGQEPTCILAGYDKSIVFLECEGGRVTIPNFLIGPDKFSVVTEELANPELKADVSTDDWPFFYMPHRVYPMTYVYFMVFLLLLNFVLIGGFFPQKPTAPDAVFFLLGAGFMLVQTKGITELGLAFGNTWHVVGIVIAGMLLFAFCSNLLVAKFNLQSPKVAFVFVLLSLYAGYAWSGLGGSDSSWTAKLSSVALLTCPVFFSGIVFSSLLARAENISRVLAANLMGAILGGLLEYNSMYFGFRFLYLLAIATYGLAFLLVLVLPSKSSASNA